MNIANWPDETPSRPHSQRSKAPIVVTLVHGTFAKDAAWVKDGSVLRAEIAGALAGHGRDVVFDVFTWSGRNSHKARIKAGYELADHIRDLRKNGIPGTRHFIVAHSHGGNVALLAHKHLDDDQHARGIATLGTPFLHAQLRGELKGTSPHRFDLAFTRESEGASGFFMTVLFFVLLGTLTPALTGRTEYPLGWAFAISNVVAILARRPYQRYVSRYAAWAWNILNGKRTAARLTDAVSFPPLERTHVLSFVYPRDEAGLVLRVLGLTTKGPTWLMDKIVVFGLLSAMILLPLGFLFSWSSVAYSGITGVDMKPYIDIFIGVIAIGSTALLAIWMLLAALRYFLSYLRGHPGGFGWERPSIHMWADVNATTNADLPHARSNHVEVVDFRPNDGKKGLRHSTFYEDRRILKALAYWMAHVT